MVNKIMQRFVVAASIACFNFVNLAQAENTASLCTPSGYTVGFFNGVWNTFQEAVISAEELSILISPLGSENFSGTSSGVWNGEPVAVEVFYNTTGSSVGANGLQDIAEVFSQRAAELDGVLQNRWELLWDGMNRGAGFWGIIAVANDNLRNVYDEYVTDLKPKMVAHVRSIRSNPPTISDYALQDARINTLATERQKLLMVAHSQGNLFVNHAYQKALAAGLTSNNVKVVHVAPASVVLSGDMTLSTNDAVILGLLSLAPGTVPDGNITIPISTKDLSGHKFVETYLDPQRNGRGQISSQVTTALNSLQTPTSTTGTQGFFTVTLLWDGSGDVDLHAIEPTGQHVYYGSKQGVAGILDVDNTIGVGPEHYYASCDANSLALGTYHFGINNYSGATGRLATVQISSFREGVLFTTRPAVSVGPERGVSGYTSPIHVVDVTVTKDLNGTYSVLAQ